MTAAQPSRAPARAKRRGIALVVVLWWIAGATALLLLSFQWSSHKSRMEHKISASMDHFYLAEGILAREVTRLKRTSWIQRWYKPAQSTALVNGAVISGTYENPEDHSSASYTGYVQDVVNFWDTGQKRLEYHTDLFLRVTYPQGQESATSRGFFCRMIFPGPTQLRPTTPVFRRFEQRLDFDPSRTDQRDAVLAEVNHAEILRERNRPASTVIVREIHLLTSRGISLARIAAAIEQAPPRAARPARPWSFVATAAEAGDGRGAR